MLKSKEEIEGLIEKTEKDYESVLEGSFADIQTNAPRALMQLTAKTKLEALYWCIDKKCPTYPYEKNRG